MGLIRSRVHILFEIRNSCGGGKEERWDPTMI